MLAQIQRGVLPGCVRITRGKSSDYRPLARFHYAAGDPATFAAVWTAVYEPDSGPPRVVGVGVLSWPSALNRTRHRVFGLRPMRFGDRLRWVNAHVRTVSRVIVHPQFRGLGLCSALIHAAVADCPTRYVEAVARMGRAHPMFDRCGFARVEPATELEALYFWHDKTAVKGNAVCPSYPLSRVPTGEG